MKHHEIYQKDNEQFALTNDAMRKLVPTYSETNIGRIDSIAAKADGEVDKLDDAFFRNNPAIAMNLDNNLSVEQFELTIQSSIGSWKLSSDSLYPYLRDRNRLYNATRRCGSKKFLSKEMWQTRKGVVALRASDYLMGLGLGVCENVAYPITVNCVARFRNNAVFPSQQSSNLAGTASSLVRDIHVKGNPVLVGFFDTVFSITATSASLNAQLFNHQAAAAMVSRTMAPLLKMMKKWNDI